MRYVRSISQFMPLWYTIALFSCSIINCTQQSVLSIVPSSPTFSHIASDVNPFSQGLRMGIQRVRMFSDLGEREYSGGNLMI